jgi:hypothetical protein
MFNLLTLNGTVKLNSIVVKDDNVYKEDVFGYTNKVFRFLSNNNIKSRLGLFWLDFFPVKPRRIIWMFEYLDIVCLNSDKSFKSLLKELLTSAAWIHFLDGHNSYKNAPNENLARELLEIYTVGPGNYTKNDIEALSKFLCGLRINWEKKSGAIFWDELERVNDEFVLWGISVKSVENLVDLLLSNKYCAINVVQRAVDFFNLAASSEELAEIAHDYWHHNYSNEVLFFSLLKLNTKTFSATIHPVETLIYLQNRLNIEFIGERTVFEILRECNFEFCHPPNVKSWNFRNRKPTIFHFLGFRVLWSIKNRSMEKESLAFKINSRFNFPEFIHYRYRWDLKVPDWVTFDMLNKNWISHVA